MTSLTTIGREQQHLEGRTVRDIVEYSPDQVNEVWCRKIFRQILQSLELQYAMRMPHRAITPDTVVFHDNGEPLLVPSDVPQPRYGRGEPGDAPDDVLRDDLTALACIVHYAITRELAPTGPLRGRAPAGYSDSLVAAVDLCMAPDPAERPRTIEALRDLLGIVALGPVTPPRHLDEEPARPAPPATLASFAAGAPDGSPPEPGPSFMHEPGRQRFNLALLGPWQRRALATGGAAILVAIAVTVFGEIRDSGSYDEIALRLPQQTEGADRAAPMAALPPGPAATAAAPAVTPAVSTAAPPAPPARSAPTAAAQAYAENAMGASGAAGTGAAGTDEAQNPVEQPAALPPPMQRPGTGASYRLQIQPWGTVYVDGVDRGVSPPVKRLTLAPGHHTVRVTNPNFHDRVLEIDTAGAEGRIAVDFSSEPAQ